MKKLLFALAVLLGLAIWMTSSFGGPSQWPRSLKISGPSPVADYSGALSVLEFDVSPDGQWVAFAQDQVTFGRQRELFARRRDGSGGVIRLNPDPVAGGAVREFFFTPDSARVVYLADQDVVTVNELYSVPVDGSGPAVKLNAPLVAGGQVEWYGEPFPITSDSQTLLYTADQDVHNRYQLYSVPTDGSAPPTALTLPGTTSYFVRGKLAPDDVTAVFTAELSGSSFGLYRVPLDGSAPIVQLNQPIVAGTTVGTFEIAADNSRVVYIQGTSGVVELFSVPLDLSGPAVRLNQPFVSTSSDFQSFELDPTSLRVVYLADAETVGRDELYSVPLDGSAAPVKLNHAFFSGGIAPEIAPNGAWVLYRFTAGSASTIYSVPIDGSVAAVAVSTGLTSRGSITPDSTRIVTTDGALRVQPIDGMGPVTTLSAPETSGDLIRSYRVTPDSSAIVWGRGSDSLSFPGLHSRPLDAAQPATVLGVVGAIAATIEWDYRIDANSNTVVFRSDAGVVNLEELFAQPIGGGSGAITLSPPLTSAPIEFDVDAFWVSPNGQRVVYLDQAGLHATSVNLVGKPVVHLTPLSLATAGHSPDVFFTPDSREVFFSVTTQSQVFLFRAPLDGHAPATLVLSHAAIPGGPIDRYRGFLLVPDGRTLVFSLSLSDYHAGIYTNFHYSMPLDGSSPPTQLFVGGTSIVSLLADGGSTYVFTETDSFAAGAWSIPVQGGALSSVVPPGHYWGGFLQVDSTDQRLVLASYDFTTFDGNLVSTSLAAPGVFTPLGTPGYSRGAVQVSPTSPHVAFLERPNHLSDWTLRYRATDGSGPVLNLASLQSANHVSELRFSPNGEFLVLRVRIDSTLPHRHELLAVRTDGSQPAAWISGSMVAGGSVTANGTYPLTGDFTITPDSTRVVFRADARVDEVFELWSAPIDGSGPVVALNHPLSPGLEMGSDFLVSDFSGDLFFRGQPNASLFPAWQARVDQTGPFQLRSGPFSHPTTVEPGIRLTVRDGHVVYRSNERDPNRIELFSFPILGRPLGLQIQR